MNHPVINCPKCEGLMEKGFIFDLGNGNYRTITTWIEGEPDKSFWTGIKTSGKQQFEISTFRCAGCGYLESYAIKEKQETMFG